jgi:hypothetical protein
MDDKLEFRFDTDDGEMIQNCIVDFTARGYILTNQEEVDNDKIKLVFKKKEKL